MCFKCISVRNSTSSPLPEFSRQLGWEEVPCSTGWWQSRARVPKRSSFVASGRAALDAPGAWQSNWEWKKKLQQTRMVRNGSIESSTFWLGMGVFLGGVVKFTQHKGSNQANLMVILYMIRLSIVHFFGLVIHHEPSDAWGCTHSFLFPRFRTFHNNWWVIGVATCTWVFGFLGYRISGFQMFSSRFRRNISHNYWSPPGTLRPFQGW